MYLKIYTIAVLLTILPLLISCGKSIKIFSKPTENIITHPIYPSPIRFDDVNFIVITKNNINDLDLDNYGALFAITVKDYEILAANMQDIQRWIKESKAVIIYYRNVVSDK